MLKRIIILLHFIFISFFSFGQVSFKIVSQEDSLPIPNVLLIQKSEGKGVASDSKGIIELPGTAISSNSDFILSAIGFEDLDINSKDIYEGKVFYLNPRVFELDTYIISSDKLVPVYLGDTISSIEKPISLRSSNPEKVSNLRFASYLNFKDNKDRIISNVWVFFGEFAGSELKIRFRWFVSNEIRKPKDGKIYSSDDFFDVGESNAVFKIDKINAWSRFDLLQDEIVIPKGDKGCYLVIDVIPNKYGKITSIKIPFQNTKGNRISPAFYFGSGKGIGTYETYGGFAMMVEYLR